MGASHMGGVQGLGNDGKPRELQYQDGLFFGPHFPHL